MSEAVLHRSPSGDWYGVNADAGLRWELSGPYRNYCLILWNAEQLFRKAQGRKPLPENEWVPPLPAPLTAWKAGNE